MQFWRVELLFLHKNTPWVLVRQYACVAESHRVLQCPHLELPVHREPDQYLLQRLDQIDQHLSLAHIIPDWSDASKQRFFYNQFASMNSRAVQTELGLDNKQ